MRIRTSAPLVSLFIAVGLLLAACGSDSPLADLDADTAADLGADTAADLGADGSPPATDPPATDAPPPATDAPPPATDAQPPATDATSDDDYDWAKVLLSVAIILAVIAIVVAIATARKKPATVATVPDAAATERRQILGRAQWVHDQQSLEVLAGQRTPEQLQVDRVQMDELMVAANTKAEAGGHEVWSAMGSKLGELSRSLELVARLGADPDVDTTVLSEARAVANRHRADLQRLIDAARGLG